VIYGGGGRVLAGELLDGSWESLRRGIEASRRD